MALRLKVLILEDNPADVRLAVAEMRRGGIDPEWERVETKEDYLARLGEPWDLILADYRLPAFDGIEALRLLKQLGLDIPFIVVSGKVGEEEAVEWMKLGAADYLLKDRLGRLGPAIDAAVKRHVLESDQRRTQAALVDSEKRFRLLAENSSELILLWRAVEPEGFEYVSPACKLLFDCSPEEFYEDPAILLRMADSDGKRILRETFAARGLPDEPFIVRYTTKKGRDVWIEHSWTPLHDDKGALTSVQGVARDITARKAAEEELRASEERFRSLVENSTDAIMVLQNGRPVFRNRVHQDLLGYTSGELPDMHVQVVAPEDRDRVRDYSARRLRG